MYKGWNKNAIFFKISRELFLNLYLLLKEFWLNQICDSIKWMYDTVILCKNIYYFIFNFLISEKIIHSYFFQWKLIEEDIIIRPRCVEQFKISRYFVFVITRYGHESDHSLIKNTKFLSISNTAFFITIIEVYDVQGIMLRSMAKLNTWWDKNEYILFTISRDRINISTWVFTSFLVFFMLLYT